MRIVRVRGQILQVVHELLRQAYSSELRCYGDCSHVTVPEFVVSLSFAENWPHVRIVQQGFASQNTHGYEGFGQNALNCIP